MSKKKTYPVKTKRPPKHYQGKANSQFMKRISPRKKG